MHEGAARVPYRGPAPAAALGSGHRRRRGRAGGGPLSDESAASVREAAFAVVRHRVRYLPIVDDGILVGVLAVGELGRPER
jgi:CBS domain-containing protein